MFDNDEILKIAMEQSAFDANCLPCDFLKSENIIAKEGLTAKARKYLREPIICNLISYGNNIVASVKDEARSIAEEYIGRYEFFHCFETPNLHFFDEKLGKIGAKVCFMAEYFLPDMEKIKPLDCGYRLKVLQRDDFANLYTPTWNNALCKDRSELDVLAAGAYDGDRLIGLAGCSADCEKMWQIGVDVLPEYRRQGVASALTSVLAMETLRAGKVPFYCCAWSNIRSARNAIRSGFKQAWVEMTAKTIEFVNNMNENK